MSANGEIRCWGLSYGQKAHINAIEKYCGLKKLRNLHSLAPIPELRHVRM